jgi:hypothetical protein
MTPMNPKPAIQLQQNDPHYLATRRHFQARRPRAAAPPRRLPYLLTPLTGGGGASALVCAGTGRRAVCLPLA